MGKSTKEPSGTVSMTVSEACYVRMIDAGEDDSRCERRVTEQCSLMVSLLPVFCDGQVRWALCPECGVMNCPYDH